ncbi:glycine betaine ABC transporter substrate-binding protein [Salimicrobium halophilum]|uniref:Glycine betaine/proline transport system substrate-binding protein n=1 Tax=Salimicrobium halophilum TaxID=86666 RepID=A0A1G8QYS8_9BACI|nr:glycine betaine ABC transporter substrate-binding protein [Salimicrobium halophilum]SDJ09858.1 glycine betaine/proline transport system substrate-binding protein [Salimicrobium halophilum]
MLKSWKKKVGIAAALSFSLIAAGCGSDSESSSDGETSVSEEVEHKIVGIEPGAGATAATDDALEAYDSLEGWEHETSSTAAMLTSLGDAYEAEEPIIVVGWSPHYKFAKWDLKYLEDPKGAYGGAEQITTLAHKGFKEENPGAYQILENIGWDISTLEELMLQAQDASIEEVAQTWIDENQDKVDEWIADAPEGDGSSVELAMTPWDSERLTGNMAKLALEQKGYDVSLTQVDPAIMFEAVAEGDADATLAAWLPKTHGSFYEEHKDSLVKVNEAIDGAKIGLAVPTYMEDTNSIEDLEPAE